MTRCAETDSQQPHAPYLALRYWELSLMSSDEASGEIERRRNELRAWFQAHPQATPADAVRELKYSYPDHMHAIADSIRIDLRRTGGRHD